MSNPHDLLCKFVEATFDHLDATPKRDDKQRDLGLIIQVWNNLVPLIASYTNVAPEAQAKARSNIIQQVVKLKEGLTKS
jgi:hypothetical protein